MDPQGAYGQQLRRTTSHQGRGRFAMLFVFALVVGLSGAVVVFLGGREPGRGAASIDEELPSPNPGLTAGPSLMPVLATPNPLGLLLLDRLDPVDLPRPPGATIVAYDEGVDGAVRWTLIEYVSHGASVDAVREHYRSVFRDTAWFVGDVGFDDGVWTFDANQAEREAQLVITGHDGRVHVTAFVSDTVRTIAAPPTPRPTAAPTAKPKPARLAPPPRQQAPPPRKLRPRDPPRNERQRPAPVRRGDRDDDRDDRDDDDDDDD